MNRIKVVYLAIFSLLSISINATATETALPQQCAKLFDETAQLITQAEKQPGTHFQLDEIKNKLQQTKQQIFEMETTAQMKSCDLILARLNNLKNYIN